MTDEEYYNRDGRDAMSNFARIISNRLDEVRRSMAIKAIDEFDLGIDCRLANEEEWLEDLLSKLECE